MDGQPMTQPTALYACLYVREFPAQALLRLRQEMRSKPVAVLEGEPPLEYVCSCNAKARSEGVVHGMTKVEIGTLPKVASLPRSRGEEGSSKATVLECAGAFSPRVEDRSEDLAFLCVIDISGTEKLFGPPESLAKSLLGRVRALGIVAMVALSADFNTALCIARAMTSARPLIIVPTGKEADALSSVPLAVLDLTERHAETFSLWGIRTLGMLAALPETSLIARIGQEGKRLRQLALGELPHLFLPGEPAFKLEEHIELDFPEDNLESLLFGVNLMLEQLILRAANRALALASVTTTLLLEGGPIHSRTVKPALPTTDRQLWLKLIRLDLEAHPPEAAILALTVRAEPGDTSKVQLGLFSPQLPEAARLDVTLARIRAIVGEDHVGRVVLKDTHRYDDFSMEPFTVPTGHALDAAISHQRTAMRQLRPIESLSVSVRDERPETFFFRGKRYAVERAHGPWMASGDWWNGSRWSIEQWDFIARSGEEQLCCCAFRDLAQNRWMMAGIYD
jgi:protein ImuB